MKKIFILSICGILFFTITGCGSSNDKNVENNKTQNNATEGKGKEISVSEEIETLITNTTPPSIFNDYDNYYFVNDKITVDKMDNKAKLLIAINNITRKNSENSLFKEATSKEEVQSEMKNLFGPDVQYTDESIDVGSCYGFASTFDGEKYTFNGGCGGMFLPFYTKKITKVLDYSDKLEVYIKLLYSKITDVDDNFMSNNIADYDLYDADKETKIGTLKSSATEPDIDEYLDKLTTYKYTFIKDNNNYYFYSIEKDK